MRYYYLFEEMLLLGEYWEQCMCVFARDDRCTKAAALGLLMLSWLDCFLTVLHAFMVQLDVFLMRLHIIRNLQLCIWWPIMS